MNFSKEYILVCGENKLESLWLILWCWMRKAGIQVVDGGALAGIKKNVGWLSFLREYLQKAVSETKAGAGQFKGLWYQLNKEVIDLTVKFYNQKIAPPNPMVPYYNGILRTTKFEAYIKKEISLQIFAVLRDLHLIRLLSLSDKKILLSQTPLNEFIVEHMSQSYGTSFEVRYVRPATNLLILLAYYGHLFKQFLRRGITFRKSPRKFKIAKEATWNFPRGTLRDDIVVDGDKITKKDLLLLNVNPNDPHRVRAFQEAAREGFETAALADLRINVNGNAPWALYFYLVVPLFMYLRLLFERRSYLLSLCVLFHSRCFPWEVFLNMFKVGYNISVYDWGDVAETIMLNKYGTQNVFFQRSDMTFSKSYLHAFIAHNIYFVWGDIHYDLHAENYFIDHKIDIGCIYKKAYKEAVNEAPRILQRLSVFNKSQKIVAFFDTAFADSIHVTTALFLEFLEIIAEFCEKHPEVNVLLKPKKDKEGVFSMLNGALERYNLIWAKLERCQNFTYLDPWEWSIESVIAVSDVCVNMAITSTSTIALICGKNALYYDNTGNEDHPMVKKHAQKIVFDDKETLLKQIDNILCGRFNCRDAISDQEIRTYDAFDDDKALERLRNYLGQGSIN